MIDPVRLYRIHAEERAAIVSVAPAYADEGKWLVRVARGPTMASLGSAGVYGPYDVDVLAQRFQEAVDSLRGEGFDTSGLTLSLAELEDPSRRRRALAARRLGWRGALSPGHFL